jgi:NADH-quinone oxidoreductase subunit C
VQTAEQLRNHIAARFGPDAVTLVNNPGPAAQHSLLLAPAPAREIARFLRDDPALRLDYCSDVSGIDWPGQEITETVKIATPDPAGGPDKITEQKTKRLRPGCLEVVYHLYSIALKTTAPVVLRLRTANRAGDVTVPSLTPVWRSCEFQEREVFDLFGVRFEGPPALRRILLWDEFKDHPMRKDYVSPDDYEWEPTPHDEVLARAKKHYPAEKPEPGKTPEPDKNSRGDAENAEAKS